MSPAFCLEKNFKLKENLQGSPSGHHLLFTLKFQNHAKYRKIANICFLLPPTPPPHAPSQTSLSRRDTLPLGSSLAPRSEPPPPHTWTVSRPPCSLRAAPRLHLPVVTLALLFWTEVLPGPHTQSPPCCVTLKTQVTLPPCPSPAGSRPHGGRAHSQCRESCPEHLRRGPWACLPGARRHGRQLRGQLPIPADPPRPERGLRPGVREQPAGEAGGGSRSAPWLLFRPSCHELPCCPRPGGQCRGRVACAPVAAGREASGRRLGSLLKQSCTPPSVHPRRPGPACWLLMGQGPSGSGRPSASAPVVLVCLFRALVPRPRAAWVRGGQESRAFGGNSQARAPGLGSVEGAGCAQEQELGAWGGAGA